MKERNRKMSMVQRSNFNSGIKSETPNINLMKLILHALIHSSLTLDTGAVAGGGCGRCWSFFLLFICDHLN